VRRRPGFARRFDIEPIDQKVRFSLVSMDVVCSDIRAETTDLDGLSSPGWRGGAADGHKQGLEHSPLHQYEQRSQPCQGRERCSIKFLNNVHTIV
jgi:hypothetical protein